MDLEFLIWCRCEIWNVVGHTEEWDKKKHEKPCKLFGTNMCFWYIYKREREREWTIQKLWGDVFPTTPSLYTIGCTYIAINLPKKNSKNEHLMHGFFLEEYPMSLWVNTWRQRILNRPTWAHGLSQVDGSIASNPHPKGLGTSMHVPPLRRLCWAIYWYGCMDFTKLDSRIPLVIQLTKTKIHEISTPKSKGTMKRWSWDKQPRTLRG